jgi:hypothetical protein
MDMPLLPQRLMPFYGLRFATSCSRSEVKVTDFSTRGG